MSNSANKPKPVSSISATVVLGRVIAFDEHDAPLVDFEENEAGQPCVAMTTVPITKQQIGQQVTLSFVNGDPARPIISGVVHEPNVEASPSVVHMRIDGETLRLRGDREIVLECGKASITLQRNGRIVVRGTNVETRASGVNKIRGRAVQLN